MSANAELATLGGGCFWCLEPLFAALKGVAKAESGYSGGKVKNPAYREVCAGNTGHAEVVQVTFDPGVISYQELLEIFFTLHDPTTLNRQGNDAGTQYRSVVFYHTPEQKRIAGQVIQETNAARIWPAPMCSSSARMCAMAAWSFLLNDEESGMMCVPLLTDIKIVIAIRRAVRALAA